MSRGIYRRAFEALEIPLLNHFGFLSAYPMCHQLECGIYRSVIGKSDVLHAPHLHKRYAPMILVEDPIAPRGHALLLTSIVGLRVLIVFIGGREVNLALCEISEELVLLV
jgi:hypothetical protein